MTRWQRRARLVIAVAAVGLAVVVAVQLKRRSPPAPSSAPIPRADPKATVESTNGRSVRLNGEHEEVRLAFDKLLQYDDGSSRMIGVTVVTERAGGRIFTITAREGKAGKNESDYDLSGDVHISVNDGMVVITEHATYTDADGMVRAEGPFTFSRGRMSGAGYGMSYNKNSDVLTVLDQASVQMQPDAHGSDRIAMTARTAEFTRPARILRLDGGTRVVRDLETTEADAAIGHLSADEQQLEALELRGHSRITGARNEPGTVKSLTGNAVDVNYAAGGRTIERAVMKGTAVVELSAERGQQGGTISANLIDAAIAKDGVTPTALTARESVQLALPAQKDAAARTVTAQAMDGTGDDRQGLTAARFTGSVLFSERGTDVSRTARSGVLDVKMGRGLSAIDEASFARAVHFDEGAMHATAAAALYRLASGQLDLTGSEPGAVTPRVQNDRIDVSAVRIEMELDGPRVKAHGRVESTLRAAKKPVGGAAATAGKVDAKVPSMLKQDQDVRVVADDLDYDGRSSKATYSGNASLWQGETKIKAASIGMDDTTGDLTASGNVTTNAMILKEGKDQQKERVASKASATEFNYRESLRRATYAGAAHLVDREGDVQAETIELYLKPSGDEIDRVEAHRSVVVTLPEKKRTATGDELTYSNDEQRYDMKGRFVTIVDECGRKDEGLTLTFFRTTDRIILNGNPQTPTQTKSDGSSCR